MSPRPGHTAGLVWQSLWRVGQFLRTTRERGSCCGRGSRDQLSCVHPFILGLEVWEVGPQKLGMELRGASRGPEGSNSEGKEERATPSKQKEAQWLCL